MNSGAKNLKESVVDYCAQIGADPLLVQGAGGNVSWKDGPTLWVKASGTWLAEAARKEIFVPVDLLHLRQAIAAGDFEVSPRVTGESPLRPSIETLMHALMPHAVVVHLHAVEVLAHLVRHQAEAGIGARLGDALRWLSVGYFKPGADLARAISDSLKQAPAVEVVFLKNHGLVIGGADVQEVDAILKQLLASFKVSPRTFGESAINAAALGTIEQQGYRPASSRAVNQLAVDGRLFERLQADWALYPDHVVFLGARAICFERADDFLASLASEEMRSELVFIRGVGVFTNDSFSDAKKAQLQCYCDVLMRQADEEQLTPLSNEDIGQLLNWDAEKYRMSLSSRGIQ